jgi:hypothetical protein
VQPPVVLKDEAGKLGECGQEGEDGGKHMDIKGGFPPRVVDIGSLEPQKTNVIPEGGIVDEDTQHQVGSDAEDQV